MDELNEIWRIPPEPPRRAHHSVKSPAASSHMLNHHQTKIKNWDKSLNDVVDDFEKTLERSKKGNDGIKKREAKTIEQTRHVDKGEPHKNVYCHFLRLQHSNQKPLNCR